MQEKKQIKIITDKYIFQGNLVRIDKDEITLSNVTFGYHNSESLTCNAIIKEEIIVSRSRIVAYYYL